VKNKRGMRVKRPNGAVNSVHKPAIRKLAAKKKDYIDDYIDAMREPTDGVLTSKEQVKYNIMTNKPYKDEFGNTITGIDKMAAYERFLIQEYHWRYPNKKGKALNKKELDKDWKQFCKDSVKRAAHKLSKDKKKLRFEYRIREVKYYPITLA